MRIEISLWPWALFWSNDLIILTISSTQNPIDENLSLVLKFILTEAVLSLDIRVNCLAKNYWVDLLYQINQLQFFSSISSGGISETLLPFTNVFKMAQYVFEAVFSSWRLLP